MLPKDKNELLTRVGPETPMGETLRRYWVPALLAEELPESDCPPVRVKLLGENLVAFRDTNSRVGLLDEFCAHRRASLFLGRNEECGLRCIYHGWKYDGEGNCVEMPNEPPESNFKDKIHLKAYPAVEMGGVVWAYLGPEERKPQLPTFDWTVVSESHRYVSKTWQECNWLQALEGGGDITHVTDLHRKMSSNKAQPGVGADGGIFSRPPLSATEIEITEYGYIQADIRGVDGESVWVQLDHHALPFHMQVES